MEEFIGFMKLNIKKVKRLELAESESEFQSWAVELQRKDRGGRVAELKDKGVL